MKALTLPTLALPALAVLASLAAPAEAGCRLALVLAMDVSRSVDAADFALQTEGLARALEDDAVREAFFAPSGNVALTVYQWSGMDHQEMLVSWVTIHQPQDLVPVSAAIRAARPPAVRQLTALGEALDFGHRLLADAPDCGRQVIDMAGDGQNNQGRSPRRVYDSADWAGITVNALAISAHELGLEAYFHAHLIHGPGAFVELANRHEDFPKAIRRKLLRELTEAVSLLGPFQPQGRILRRKGAV